MASSYMEETAFDLRDSFLTLKVCLSATSCPSMIPDLFGADSLAVWVVLC